MANGLIRPQQTPEQQVFDPRAPRRVKERSTGRLGYLHTINNERVFIADEPANQPEAGVGGWQAWAVESGQMAQTFFDRLDAMMGDEAAMARVQAAEAPLAGLREEHPIATALAISPLAATPGGLPAQVAAGMAEGALMQPESPVIGGATGGAFAFLGQRLGDAVSQRVQTAIARRSSDTARQARGQAMQWAQEANIPLTVANRADSVVAQLFDRQASTVLGRAVKGPTKQRALNNAFAEALGVPGATALTGDVLSTSARQYGEVFERVASEVDEIPLSDAFAAGIERLESMAADLVPNARAMRQLERVVQFAASDSLNGQQYNRLRSELSRISQAMWSPGGDQVSGEFVDQIIGVLDEALAEVAPADMVSDIADARGGWRLLAAVRRGAAIDPEGNVNPVTMQRNLERSYQGLDLNRFAPGAIGQAQRANVASLAFPEFRSSGTPERSIMANVGGLTAGLAEIGVFGGAGGMLGGGTARLSADEVARGVEATADGLIAWLSSIDDSQDSDQKIE